MNDSDSSMANGVSGLHTNGTAYLMYNVPGRQVHLNSLEHRSVHSVHMCLNSYCCTHLVEVLVLCSAF